MKKAIVNSLPKSGTNLLAKCLTLFGYKEKGHISTGSVLDNSPASLLRRLWWGSNSHGYSIGVNTPIEVRKLPIDCKLKRLSDKQFITSHVGYDSRLLESVIGCDITPIQVLRDPRAVLASFVPYVLQDKQHFLSASFQRMSTEERYQSALLGGEFNELKLNSIESYCRALAPWVTHKAVTLIRFEDIVGKNGGGCDNKRDAALELLADKLELPKEKIPAVADALYGPGRHTFRKGHIDSWREELPPSVRDLISVELSEILTLWGYED